MKSMIFSCRFHRVCALPVPAEDNSSAGRARFLLLPSAPSPLARLMIMMMIVSVMMMIMILATGETKDLEIEKKGVEIQALTSTLETAKV